MRVAPLNHLLMSLGPSRYIASWPAASFIAGAKYFSSACLMFHNYSKELAISSRGQGGRAELNYKPTCKYADNSQPREVAALKTRVMPMGRGRNFKHWFPQALKIKLFYRFTRRREYPHVGCARTYRYVLRSLRHQPAQCGKQVV